MADRLLDFLVRCARREPWADVTISDMEAREIVDRLDRLHRSEWAAKQWDEVCETVGRDKVLDRALDDIAGAMHIFKAEGLDVCGSIDRMAYAAVVLIHDYAAALAMANVRHGLKTLALLGACGEIESVSAPRGTICEHGRNVIGLCPHCEG